MAPLLRRMMGRRQLSDDATQAGESDIHSTFSNKLQKIPKSATSARHDLSNIPPVPEPKFTASKDTDALTTPPRSLLHRYKEKSVASLSTTDINQATLPSDIELSPTSKNTSFAEHFDHSLTPSPSKSPARPRFAATRVERINGVAFNMMPPAASDENITNGGTDANTQEAEKTKDHRSTRSKSRRAERSDSAQADVQSDITDKDYVMVKDFAKAPADTLDLPQPLTIRKKEASRTPSPRTSGEIVQPPQPAHKSIKTIQSDKKRTPSPNQPSSSPPIRSTRATPSSTPPIPIATPPRDYDTVHVRPPIYDFLKTSSQQWESDLGSTSRPSRPWDWSKRWTCCRCDGQTIVEQIVCSNLECVHDRCPEKCRVIKWSKPVTMFPARY